MVEEARALDHLFSPYVFQISMLSSRKIQCTFGLKENLFYEHNVIFFKTHAECACTLLM